MHWFWEDADKRERGYCSVAVSRTQHMMWQKELEERDIQAPRQPAAPPAAAGNVSKIPSRRALRSPHTAARRALAGGRTHNL